jgi:UDP-glucose 4-epimerase
MAPSSARDLDRVLVTGGCGFIGRAVVAALRREGSQVIVADREPPAPGWDEGVTVVTGDLSEAWVREAAFADGVSAVVHLAALTSVLRSVDAPARTFAENVTITQELLELARDRHTQRFVLASTNAVVGDVGTAVITEDLPLRPLTPYGATKAACEMLLSAYAGSYGMATSALRFTNVYGPGMSHKDSFVPRLMRAALSGTGIRVYGDGKQRRDLVHLDDVVGAIQLALDRKFTGRAIVGAGRSVSVLELVDAARLVTGCPLPIEHVPAPAGEMPAVVVDLSRSAGSLGYKPAVRLEDGLERTWHDFRSPGPR